MRRIQLHRSSTSSWDPKALPPAVCDIGDSGLVFKSWLCYFLSVWSEAIMPLLWASVSSFINGEENSIHLEELYKNELTYVKLLKKLFKQCLGPHKHYVSVSYYYSLEKRMKCLIGKVSDCTWSLYWWNRIILWGGYWGSNPGCLTTEPHP